ncbi:tetratricopeptide repeat protein [Rhodanobacter sp. Col0626]|uniref:tetratricopeptide repeat protein n=1 Tax=Rhodanobacter sp. Col0626 TaxID=3415679 RepID=UPI003CEF7CDD
MSESRNRGYAFGDFRIDTTSRRLLRSDGTPVPLTPRVFDTLMLLVENGGKILSKDVLMAAIWPNRIVEENNLTQNISTLRRVLGASAGDHRYILTEPGQGYRFVEPVRAESFSDGVSDSTVSTPEDVDPTSSPHEVSVDTPQIAAMTTPAARVTRRAAMAVALVVLMIVVAATGWLWRARNVAPSPTPSLAVLPFKPLTADSRNEVLQLGMADTLITKLSTNPHVVVRSLDAVRHFTRAEQDPVAAGRALGVGSVLEGYIQRQGDHVRINARLLAVPGGEALWTGTFDAKFSDVFALQDAITQKVAASLSLKLDRDERRRMEKNYTSNIAAYQRYLDGRFHLQNATPAELVASIDAFQRALEIDPDYALAYVGLAEGYRRQAIISDADPQIVLPLARTAAMHALRIDDTLAEAYVPIGFVHFWYDWDWAAAEAAFRRGIELQPNFADLHFGYAALLSNLGRNDEALRESQRARELDPTSPLYVALEASFVAYAGHVDEARQQIEGVLRVHPDFWIAHLTLGWLDTNADRYADAVNDFRKASALSGGSQQAVSMLGFALARANRKPEAQQLLDALLVRSQQQYLPATSIATIYCGLGENDQALRWLERAHAAHDVRMTFLKVDHRWDTLRGDPRFVTLMREMRLP